jgi:hypothetical protein
MKKKKLPKKLIKFIDAVDNLPLNEVPSKTFYTSWIDKLKHAAHSDIVEQASSKQMEQINNSQFHIQSSHVLKASSRTLIAVDT